MCLIPPLGQEINLSACHGRHTARIASKPRRQGPQGSTIPLAIRLKVRVRREMSENRGTHVRYNCSHSTCRFAQKHNNSRRQRWVHVFFFNAYPIKSCETITPDKFHVTCPKKRTRVAVVQRLQVIRLAARQRTSVAASNHALSFGPLDHLSSRFYERKKQQQPAAASINNTTDHHLTEKNI